MAATTAPALPVTVTVTASASRTVAPAPADPENVALAVLQKQQAQDLDSTTFDGRWVLQVASKFDGVTDALQVTRSGSHTFHNVDILSEYRSLRTRLEASGITVHLLRSNDFGTTTVSHPERIWVTLADPGGLYSADDAMSECRSLFPELDDRHLRNACVGRRLLPPGVS
ncbi:hypothetical protein V3N99_21340 [Dermatophilaceae bacterium Soc4.6]